MTVTAASATAADATALEHLMGSDQVLRDPESLERYRHDDAEWADSTAPLAVVLARSTDDVVTAVRWAAAAGLRVVPAVPAPACPAVPTRWPTRSSCRSNG